MSYGLHAQVTIGSNIPSKKGAILDLNENIPDASNTQVNSTKGLLLPRVKLDVINSLSPAIPGYTAGTADPAHTGLTVYNVNETSPFVAGIYTWNGDKWVCIRDDAGAWKIGGNTGTDAAVNYLGTSDNQPLILKANNNEGLRISTSGNVGINTNNPGTSLDVNGKLTVRDVSELNLASSSVAKQLYIDANTGLLGLQPAGVQVASPIFFASTNRTIFSNGSYLTDFNACNDIILTPVNGDIELNNLGVTFDSGKNAFKIHDNGTYQAAAVLNFYFATANSGDKVFINVRIEKSADAGANWTTITGTRPVCSVDWNNGQYISVSIPLTVQPLQAGDLIRIVFNRTKAGGGTILQGSALTEIRLTNGYSTPTYTLSLTRL
ncbi:MAG: hypothetical protein LBL90_10765 [Prevotellaceae bacterium]|nr:hypothetical protein [Prevotellaceae bacterium]